MKYRLSVMLAGSSILAIASTLPAHAQSAPQQRAAVADLDTEEIIVTARRKAESLQDVPQTVTAVTGNELEKLNLLNFTDLDKVVSGLQLVTTGFNSVGARGVTFNVASAAFAPTVAEYVNDAPTLTSAIFQSIYDVGQIEVLRGPQGTLHGISTPSGAITFTTKKPDLNKIGGYADITVTNRSGRNYQAGVNVPVIEDKLAIRIAGMEDENENGGIHSVNSRIEPSAKTESARVSVRFEPTDNISANVMYQELQTKAVSLGGAEFGTGGPGGPSAAPNYNGPALGQFDRLTAADQASVNKNIVDLLNGQLDWTFAGQKLSYVGSYTHYILKSGGGGTGGVNTLPGYLSPAANRTPDNVNTHELRLSSVDRIANMFDYTVGVYHSYEHVDPEVNNGVSALLPGFFGPSLASVPNPYVFNENYQLASYISGPRTTKETSIFANVTAHLGDKLEVSGGLRHIMEKNSLYTLIYTTQALSIFPIPGLTTGGCLLGATYPNVCSYLVPQTNRIGPTTTNFDHKPWIYSGTISYHFTPDIMAYVNTGSSWREGPYTIGLNNYANDATLNSLTILTPETSKSYEGGVKWAFLDRRAHVNVDYYHQTFKGLIFTSPFAINYYQGAVINGSGLGTYNFNSNVPAKVDGIDVDLGMEVTKQWSVSGNFSWANGKVSGSIPCNDSNFDGVPDTGVPPANGSTFIAAGKSVAYCKSSASTSTGPKWNFNVQSEYDMTVNDTLDGFVRGLLSYQPRNPNASQVYVIPAYASLNLYLGLRSPDRNWELSFFGKNITNHTTILSQGANPSLPYISSSTQASFGASGYTSISLTPRREFGLNVRYAFGAG